MTAWLSLGSDRGNRVSWLRQGLSLLTAAGLRIGAVSSFYLTEPVGDASLPWFVNCVAAVQQPPDPDVLLGLCREVENRCGRQQDPRGPRWQARTLDIDLLLYDLRLIDGPGIRVPHPRMHDRRFVLQPLAEIAPTAVHPGFGRNAVELLTELSTVEKVWLLAPPPA